jgi:hypothetical protein
MITEVEKVKVGCFVLCVYKVNNRFSIYEITEIDKNDRFLSQVYNADADDPNSFVLIKDLFNNRCLTDYVFENKKEMENNFPEYFI